MPNDTLTEAAAALRRGETTSVALVGASLDAIDRMQPLTNAFTVIEVDAAQRAAALADREREQGMDRGPLHGMPISVKDLIDVAGMVTSAGSRVLRDRVATENAVVISRLKQGGAVIIGRTNLHEFALGTTSEDTAFGAVRNPKDAGHSAGGSSGGSAAAVATGMGLASIGTDTGGSIRIPAAACGIVGLKGTFGEVPTDGVIPLSPSFDHVGPLARSVQDAAAIWAVLAGRPSAPVTVARADRLRLGRVAGYFDILEPHVRQAFDLALDRLRGAGVAIDTVEIAGTESITPAYVNTVLPEAAAWHKHYLDNRGADYTPPVRERLEAGRKIAAVDYLAARTMCAWLRAQVDAALGPFDALVLPTLPIAAPPIGAAEITIDGDVRVPVRAAMLKQTQLFNMTGHPAISLPVPVHGLPVGLQLVGAMHSTARLLTIAAACEGILQA